MMAIPAKCIFCDAVCVDTKVEKWQCPKCGTIYKTKTDTKKDVKLLP